MGRMGIMFLITLILQFQSREGCLTVFFHCTTLLLALFIMPGLPVSRSVDRGENGNAV